MCAESYLCLCTGRRIHVAILWRRKTGKGGESSWEEQSQTTESNTLVEPSLCSTGRIQLWTACQEHISECRKKHAWVALAFLT